VARRLPHRTWPGAPTTHARRGVFYAHVGPKLRVCRQRGACSAGAPDQVNAPVVVVVAEIPGLTRDDRASAAGTDGGAARN
jgi:hypothetical protein